MSDRLEDPLKTRLYAALKHSRGCSCGECSGGLNAVDEVFRQRDSAQERADSLRFELDGLEHVRLKDNAYLLERAERAETLARLVLAFTEEIDEDKIPRYDDLAELARAVLAGRDSGTLTEDAEPRPSSTASGASGVSALPDEPAATGESASSVSAGRGDGG